MKHILLMAVFVFTTSLTSFALDIGDKAPALDIKTWYNGDAVDPSKPDGKTTYVVEFWATWCGPCLTSIPHLNELSKKFKDQHLVVVGISDESAAKVEPFVKRMNMEYLVAADTERNAHSAYMKGVSGIPHAFVVDKTGKVVWSGHPMSGLDGVVEKVLTGNYSAENDQKTRALETRLEQSLGREDWPAVDEILGELTKLNPLELRYYNLKIGILIHREKGDETGPVFKEMLKAFDQSAPKLAQLAEMAFATPLPYRDPETAWTAIHKAAEMTSHKDREVLTQLANVYLQLGLPEKAKETQEKLVALASNDNPKEAKAVLDYYDRILTLRKSLDQK